VKVRLAKRAGDLESLDAGRRTLADFIDEWWRLAAEPRLAKTTLGHYKDLRDRYVVPRLGRYELRRLTPQALQQFVSDLNTEGVGEATVLKTLALLSGVLTLAEEWGYIRTNPVRLVRKPRQSRKGAVRPLVPETVEAIAERSRNLEGDGGASFAFGASQTGQQARPGRYVAGLRSGQLGSTVGSRRS
jgi:site-specific recombinase XerD